MQGGLPVDWRAEAAPALRVVADGLCYAIDSGDFERGVGFFVRQLKVWLGLRYYRAVGGDEWAVLGRLARLLCDEVAAAPASAAVPAAVAAQACGALAQLLRRLKKRAKKEKTTGSVVALDWRRLWDAALRIAADAEAGTMLNTKPVAEHAAKLFAVVRSSRRFFPQEAAHELLARYREQAERLPAGDRRLYQSAALLCSFTPCFVPVQSNTLDAYLEEWSKVRNSSTWDTLWMTLVARLVHHQPSLLMQRYLPSLFTKILESFSLVVAGTPLPRLSSKSFRARDSELLANAVLHGHRNPQARAAATFIATAACTLPDPTLHYFECLMGALTSFYQPSNMGFWTGGLVLFMKQLAERYSRRALDTPESALPQAARDAFVSRLVSSCVSVVAFSKSNVLFACVAAMQLAHVSPAAVLPDLTASALHALEDVPAQSQTGRPLHHQRCAIEILASVAHPLLTRWEQGPPLLEKLIELTLPGINYCDLDKTNAVLKFYVRLLLTLPPLPAPADAATLDPALRCLAKFPTQALERIFELLKNVDPRADSSSRQVGQKDRDLRHVDSLFRLLLWHFSALLFAEASPLLFIVLLKLLTVYLRYSKPLHAVAETCIIVEACAAARPAAAVPALVRVCREELSETDISEDDAVWWLRMLGAALRYCGAVTDFDAVAVSETVKPRLAAESPVVRAAACRALKQLLRGLCGTYPLETAAQHAPSCVAWRSCCGCCVDIPLRWHVPSAQERDAARALLERFLGEAAVVLDQCMGANMDTGCARKAANALDIVRNLFKGVSELLQPIAVKGEWGDLTTAEGLARLRRFAVLPSSEPLLANYRRDFAALHLQPLLQRLAANPCESVAVLEEALAEALPAVLTDVSAGRALDRAHELYRVLCKWRRRVPGEHFGRQGYLSAVRAHAQLLAREVQRQFVSAGAHDALAAAILSSIATLCLSAHRGARAAALVGMQRCAKCFGDTMEDAVLVPVLARLTNPPALEQERDGAVRGAAALLLRCGTARRRVCERWMQFESFTRAFCCSGAYDAQREQALLFGFFVALLPQVALPDPRRYTKWLEQRQQQQRSPQLDAAAETLTKREKESIETATRLLEWLATDDAPGARHWRYGLIRLALYGAAAEAVYTSSPQSLPLPPQQLKWLLSALASPFAPVRDVAQSLLLRLWRPTIGTEDTIVTGVDLGAVLRCMVSDRQLAARGDAAAPEAALAGRLARALRAKAGALAGALLGLICGNGDNGGGSSQEAFEQAMAALFRVPRRSAANWRTAPAPSDCPFSLAACALAKRLARAGCSAALVSAAALVSNSEEGYAEDGDGGVAATQCVAAEVACGALRAGTDADTWRDFALAQLARASPAGAACWRFGLRYAARGRATADVAWLTRPLAERARAAASAAACRPSALMLGHLHPVVAEVPMAELSFGLLKDLDLARLLTETPYELVRDNAARLVALILTHSERLADGDRLTEELRSVLGYVCAHALGDQKTEDTAGMALTRLIEKAVNASCVSLLQPLLPQLLPALFALSTAVTPETAKAARHLLSVVGQALKPGQSDYAQILGIVGDSAGAKSGSKWHVRECALPFLQLVAYNHSFAMTASDASATFKHIVDLVYDPQVEVRNVASTTLSAFLRCAVAASPYHHRTEDPAAEPATALQRAVADFAAAACDEGADVRVRHGGALGLCGIAGGFPHTAPVGVLPATLARLLECAQAKDQLVGASARAALRAFWHSHAFAEAWEVRQRAVFQPALLAALRDCAAAGGYGSASNSYFV
eukprot:TRINITY_DN7294_c0_g1_i1.p1 TRINITY_DN7294_c0_g1~~TRINITY_DN7294_c0_g1_i1.p1  ORF type:complete len:1791 (-),score=422.95 TRINITY_DN7294_c0_g1_i1:49-5367(-)